MNLAFFCTGEGSFLKFILLNSGLLRNIWKIVLLCDRDCGIYHFCKDKIEVKLIDRKLLGNQKFEEEACQWLESHGIDYVLLSCNHILRYDLLRNYGEEKQKMFNCHPSLLPNYIGFGAVEKSYESNDLVYGATIHYVTKEVDMGEPIARCILRKKKERFEDYKHRLFVNQALLMLDFVYCLGRGGGISSLESLGDSLVSRKYLDCLGFCPTISLALDCVQFFNANDKELLEI